MAAEFGPDESQIRFWVHFVTGSETFGSRSDDDNVHITNRVQVHITAPLWRFEPPWPRITIFPEISPRV